MNDASGIFLDLINGVNPPSLAPRAYILFHSGHMINTVVLAAVGLAVTRFLYLTFAVSRPVLSKAPWVGYRAFFEPTLLVRLRFLTNAADMCQEGFSRFRNMPFALRRMDMDITILPTKYLDEARLVPVSRLSGTHANVNNIVGKWTYADMFLKTVSHKTVLRKHLTPNLAKFVDMARQELQYGFDQDLGHIGHDWEEINVQALTSRLVARMSSKVFIGDPTCRNKEWLGITVIFTICFFATVLTLRSIPPALQPFLAPLLPQRWALRWIMGRARKIVIPVIDDHRAQQFTNPTDTNFDDLLGWLIANGKGEESEPENLTQRLLIMTLASIHTTSLSSAHAIFDLINHPEYLDELRAEILQFSDGENITLQQLDKMRLLDSWLEESLRMNPPLTMTPQRLALDTIKFRDGTIVPKGAMVAFPSFAVSMDPLTFKNAADFDGYRALRKRELSGDTSVAQGSASTGRDKLMFGHGTGACPGRFFATSEMKLFLAKLILNFDLKMPEGKKKPREFTVDEFRLLDPRGKVMIRCQPN